MTVNEALATTWDSARADAKKDERAGVYHRRIPLTSLQPARCGIVFPADLRLLSFDLTKTDLQGLNLFDKPKGYLIDIEEQGDSEKVLVSIREERTSLPKDLFQVFCVDILEHISRCENTAETAKTLFRRLRVWKWFFQNRALQGFPREQYIGLFGEIEFFEHGLNNGLNPQLLSDAWQGPFGANQDFLFGELAIEVKAVSANETASFRVSNIRQLDNIGLNHLFLSHTAYDFRKGSGRRMSALIQSVKELLEQSPEALEVFNDGLQAAGYSEPDQSPYADYGFTVRERSYYTIAEGFPRILEKQIAAGVCEVCYTVQLAACQDFIVSEMQLISELKNLKSL